MPKFDRRGISTSAGWKRQHGDKDTPSNWRSPPRPGAKSPEQGRSYNRLNRKIGRRREGGGWVLVARKRSNVRGARDPAVCNVSFNREGKDEMGAADKAENLTGCKSLYRQLPVFGRLAYPVRVEVTKHDMPGRKSPGCPVAFCAAVGTIWGASKLGGRNI